MIRVKDLKKGQVVYECERGTNMRYTVLEDARRDINPEQLKDGHSCRVLCGEDETELFEAVKTYGYGLRLYDSPQYHGPTIG